MTGPESRRGLLVLALSLAALLAAPASVTASGAAGRAAATIAMAAQELTGEPVPPVVPDGQPPPSAAAGDLPPRPVLVEPITDAAGGTADPDGDAGTDEGAGGAVRVRPFAEVFVAEPGRSYQPTFVIDNHSEVPVDLELDVVALGVGEDGAPRVGGGRVEALAPARGWITLPTDRLHLDPSERAFVWPAVDVPPDALVSADGDGPVGAGAAIRAVGDGLDLAAFVVLVPGAVGGSDAAVRLVRGGAGNARLDLELTAPADAADVVTGRVAVRGWFGTVVALDIPPTLVAPGTPRVQTVEFTGPALPGRYEAVADLRSLDGSAPRATTSAWLNPSRTVLAGGAIVLVLTAIVLLYRVRRQRGIVHENG